MKLYASSVVCFGLLVLFICPKEKTLVVSDFCLKAGADIVRLKNLTDAELAPLKRPRKEALLSLQRIYNRDCMK